MRLLVVLVVLASFPACSAAYNSGIEPTEKQVHYSFSDAIQKVRLLLPLHAVIDLPSLCTDV